MKFNKIAILLALAIIISCSPKDQPKTARETPKPQTGQSVNPQNSISMVGGKYVLKLNLQKGKSYPLKMITDQKVTQTIMNQKQTTKERIGVTYSYDVENVEPSGLTSIKVTYKAFLQEAESPQGKMSYNSANPADKDNPFSKVYAPLLNKGFNMKITPSGKVQQISGVDALLKGIISNMDIPPQAYKKSIEKMISDQFGDNSIREMMENLMAIYPENPVSAGDSWSRKFTLTRGFPASFESIWTLKEVKDGKAVVQLNTKVKGLNPPIQKAGPPMPKYKISGEQIGTYQIDLASGWVTKSVMNQKLTGKIEIEKSEQVQKAMSFPVSIESTITTEASK